MGKGTINQPTAGGRMRFLKGVAHEQTGVPAGKSGGGLPETTVVVDRGNAEGWIAGRSRRRTPESRRAAASLSRRRQTTVRVSGSAAPGNNEHLRLPRNHSRRSLAVGNGRDN